MIITNEFIMLNLPKTGSSFARSAIKLLYKNRFDKLSFPKKAAIRLKLREPLFKELFLPNIRIKGVDKGADCHGTFTQIPDQYKQRDVFSIVRNPYERLISGYEYKAWVRHPSIPKELVSKFPQFPELSLDEFIEMSKITVDNELKNGSKKTRIGFQSLQFIRMFFKNPEDVLKNISDDYIDSDRYLDDIANITFLRQENLREDIKNLLERHGFDLTELKMIDELKKVNETKNKSKNRNDLLTPKAINYINEEERFILKVLRYKGIEYSCPKIDYSNVS